MKAGGILLAVLAAGPAASCAPRAEVRYLPRGGARGAGLFEAGPLSEGERASLRDGEIDFERGSKLLALHVDPGTAGATEFPAVAGAYRLEGKTLLFEPGFPLVPGVRYRVLLRPGGHDPVAREVLLPAGTVTSRTVVEAVYPSPDVLPENLLKFYLVFSAPMSRGQAWSRLRLTRASGEAVYMPFLELEHELWDPGGRRLTVFIDPGRIKRGLRPLEDVGPALVAGESYELEVLREWEDAEGNPLEHGHRKAFRVGPADRDPIDPAAWKVTPPCAGGREPLVVVLGETLDHGLLHDAVGVEGPGGRGLDGEIRLGVGEGTWSFTPARAWAHGEHQLVVATTLEDLAGNSVGRPFEVDLLEAVRRIDAGAVKVPFRPGSPGAPSASPSGGR